MRLRPIEDAEYQAFYRADELASSRHATEAGGSSWRSVVELDRTVAAFDQGEIVGTAHSQSVEIGVPGGSLPAALVDMVGVLPSHRRRGILTRMMAHQLRDVHERGEVLAGLAASEGAIYGRFGYGVGSMQEDWSIAREHTAFVIPPGSGSGLRFLGSREARWLLPGLYERVRSLRPGMVKYKPSNWDLFLSGPVSGGLAPLRVVSETKGRPNGYARYTVTDESLLVQELMATTREAYAALWRYCFDAATAPWIQAVRRPLDDPLPWMLADPRRLERTVADRMWLRLVDVEGALSGRTYGADGRLVLQVGDSFCPWNEGLYGVEVRKGAAQCRKGEGRPDLALSAADLATVYLGAVRPSTLSRAGRVEELTPGALRRADSMFAVVRKPWGPYNL